MTTKRLSIEDYQAMDEKQLIAAVTKLHTAYEKAFGDQPPLAGMSRHFPTLAVQLQECLDNNQPFQEQDHIIEL